MTVIAGMTAFYMFRLYYGIFWAGSEPGQKSASDGGDSHEMLEFGINTDKNWEPIKLSQFLKIRRSTESSSIS